MPIMKKIKKGKNYQDLRFHLIYKLLIFTFSCDFLFTE